LRVKISVNDAYRRYELHAKRLGLLLEAIGAKPLGPWRRGMDAGTALTSAYYAETLEREYEWDGTPEDLKELMMGAEYVRLPSNPGDSPFVLKLGDDAYVKVCDVDVYYYRKGFLGGWFKVHSRALARQRRLAREELLKGCIRRLEDLTQGLREDLRAELLATSRALAS